MGPGDEPTVDLPGGLPREGGSFYLLQSTVTPKTLAALNHAVEQTGYGQPQIINHAIQFYARMVNLARAATGQTYSLAQLGPNDLLICAVARVHQ